MARSMTLQLTVVVPDDVGESEVERALNEALDEPPCDWENWTVGGVEVVSVERTDNEVSDGL